MCRLSLFFSWIVSVSSRGFVDCSLGLQVKFHSEGIYTVLYMCTKTISTALVYVYIMHQATVY